LKKAIAAAVVSIAMVTTPAISQTNPPTSPAIPPAAKPNTGSSMQPQWYSHHGDEMRASKLIGATVRNEANESIGEINELILTKDGKVAAAVVGVGGFLGIGEREVALDYKSLKFEHDNSATARADTMIVRVNATKDSLKAAPAWTWNDRNGAASGSAPATRPATDSTRK
jgi:hypothetical protein